MHIKLKKLLLLFSVIIVSCNTYDTKKFGFKVGPEKYQESVTIFKNGCIEIDLHNEYASYPNKEYEFGINTEVRFWNRSIKTITVDSIKLQHIHNTVNISDSVRFENDITLPYSFKKSQGESFSLFSSTFFVDNSRTNFEVGDILQGLSEIWFKIDGEPYHISRNFTKEYRRLRGVYTP